MLRRRAFLTAALLAAVSLPAAGQKSSKAAVDLSRIDPVVTAMMAEWHVPGLALGVIKDGKVVYAKGYGYRDVEAKLPVTPRTLMAIGSNSKSFTTVILGMLVDQKKVAWDTPVISICRISRCMDEYATKHMTPRDLVVAPLGAAASRPALVRPPLLPQGTLRPAAVSWSRTPPSGPSGSTRI